MDKKVELIGIHAIIAGKFLGGKVDEEGEGPKIGLTECPNRKHVSLGDSGHGLDPQRFLPFPG